MVLNQVLRKLALITIGVIQLTPLWAQTKTIAVLPFSFKNSRPEPEQTIKKTTQEILEKLGFTVHNQENTLKTWKEDLKFQKPVSMPSNTNLIKLGQKINVNYVCTGIVKWIIRTPWIGTGPKVKAECIMNCKVIDINTKKVVLDAKNIKVDSHKKENGLEIAADLLLTPLVTLVSSGSRIPHMNHSGQVATLKALSPFVKYMKSSQNSTSCCTKKKTDQCSTSCCTKKKIETTQTH